MRRRISLPLFLITAALLSGCSSSKYIEGMYTPATTRTSSSSMGTSSSPIVSSSSSSSSSKTPDSVVSAPSVSNSKNVDVKRKAVVATAKKYVGCKYKAASTGPKRFDCSGFTYFVYQQYGITLSRSSSDQYTQGVSVKNTRNLKVGDLVFWRGSNAKNPRVGHVGIVTEADSRTGQFSFIHAAMTGVQINHSEEEYYKVRYVGARRVLQ